MNILLLLGKSIAVCFFIVTALFAWGLTYQNVPPFKRVVDRLDTWEYRRRRRLKRMIYRRPRPQQTDSSSIGDTNESLDRHGPYIGWCVVAFCIWQLLRAIGG